MINDPPSSDALRRELGLLSCAGLALMLRPTAVAAGPALLATGLPWRPAPALPSG